MPLLGIGAVLLILLTLMVASHTWTRPVAEDLKFDFRIGETVLEQFARAHDPAAILRELIQNEYDARGSRLEVAFGNEGLTIKGNGQPIDKKGWLRLSVVLGTGRVPGTSDFVTPKANGIGEKNFGLRSLFVIGDELWVRSNGWQTILNRERGSLAKPIPDKASENTRGIEIFVPYRTKKVGRLEAFTLDSEARFFERLASSISLALLKLADVSLPNSLNELVVSSGRHDRTISWKQRVRRLPSPPGITCLSRQVKASDSRGGNETIEELEWQRSVPLPDEYDFRLIPGYFRLGSRRVRYGVSLRTKNGRLSADQPAGITYYPIGVPQLYTGNKVSLSAPFDMNFDRSLLNDPAEDTINKWLLESLADLTIDVLKQDWFARFGANAYLAVGEINDAAIPIYADWVKNNLRTTESWAVRPPKNSRKPKIEFASLSNVNVPADPRLDGFLSDSRYLHPTLASKSEVGNLAIDYGVKVFSLNSLVRLFCSGETSSNLKTKLSDGESNYYFTGYPEALNDLDRLLQFLTCVDALWPKLSPANRSDLESILLKSASDELQPAHKLKCVPLEIQNACPLPAVDRLHTLLVPIAQKRKLCKRFNSDQWAYEVADRAESDAVTEEERAALYRFVLAVNGHFSPRTRAMVRRSPILKDHQKQWTKPSSITLPNARGAREIKAALHLPHREFARNTELARVLRFKQRITGEDLVAYARIVSEDVSLAVAFERTLSLFKSLLTKKIVSELKSIAFLLANDGLPHPPEVLYLNNSVNLACVGQDALYVGGQRTTLYNLLGSKPRPDVDGILNHLADLAQHGAEPSHPRLLYPELMKALQRENRSTLDLSDSELLWNGTGYSTPRLTLVGNSSAKLLRAYLPCVPNLPSVVRDAYLALGARVRPQDEHWTEVLTSIGKEYLYTTKALSTKQRDIIRVAYQGLKSLPNIPDDVPWLLDRDGKLHFRSAATSLNFLIDDEAELADALTQASTDIAFADTSVPVLLSFYQRLGIQSLSNVRTIIGHTIGSSRSAPHWFNENEIVRKISSATFLDAIERIALHSFSDLAEARDHFRFATRKLRATEAVKWVDTLTAKYRVNKFGVPISVKATWKNGSLYLTYARKISEMNGLLAGFIAGEYLDRVSDQRSLADAVYRLLTSDSEQDFRDYLLARGVRVADAISIVDEDEIDDTSEDDDLDEIRSTLVQSIVPATKPIRPTDPPIPPRESDVEEDHNDRETISLPPIDQVDPIVIAATPGWTKQMKTTGTGGGGGGWTRTVVQRSTERDHAVGQRGEEIVFLMERKRVTELGFPQDRVRWIAKEFPTADYDILSVGDDGEDLVIEVKSTTGTDGRFHWAKAEFQRALHAREHYILCRVFLATSCAPVVRTYRDPTNLLSVGSLQLDVEVFHGEVEPLGTVGE